MMIDHKCTINLVSNEINYYKRKKGIYLKLKKYIIVNFRDLLLSLISLLFIILNSYAFHSKFSKCNTHAPTLCTYTVDTLLRDM